MSRNKGWFNAFILILALLAGLATGLLVRQVLAGGEDQGSDRATIQAAKDNLQDEQDRYELLKSQNSELENRKRVLLSRFEDDEDAAEVLAEFRENAFMAGMTDVSGSGITVTLDDKINYDPYTDPIEAVIHDSTINYVVNLLWSGGARAVAFNGIRLTAVSEISCVGPTILCYDVRQMPPYVIEAIGPAEDMGAVLAQDSYLTHLTQSKIGVRLTVQEKDQLLLPSFSRTHDYLPYINWLRMP